MRFERKDGGGRVCVNHRGNVETRGGLASCAEKGKAISPKSVMPAEKGNGGGSGFKREAGLSGNGGYLQMNDR